MNQSIKFNKNRWYADIFMIFSIPKSYIKQNLWFLVSPDTWQLDFKFYLGCLAYRLLCWCMLSILNTDILKQKEGKVCTHASFDKIIKIFKSGIISNWIMIFFLLFYSCLLFQLKHFIDIIKLIRISLLYQPLSIKLKIWNFNWGA